MSLPSLATVEDMSAVVGILYGKMSGDTIKNAKASTTKPSIFTEQRLEAYQAWGLLTVEGERLKLTNQGRKLHEHTEEQQHEVYAEVLRKIPLYEITLRHIHSGSYEERIVAEIGSHWADNFAEQVATNNDRLLGEQVTAFMSVVAGAGLGRYVRGRKGKPTRLEINRGAVGEFISGAKRLDSPTEHETAPVIDTETEEQQSKVSAYVQPQETKHVNPIFSPDVNINIQIHISADAEKGQIDDIFASMARHLFNKDAS